MQISAGGMATVAAFAPAGRDGYAPLVCAGTECTGPLRSFIFFFDEIQIDFCPPCAEDEYGLKVVLRPHGELCEAQTQSASAVTTIVEVGLGHIEFRGEVGRWEDRLALSSTCADDELDCNDETGLCNVGGDACLLPGANTVVRFADATVAHSNLGGYGPDSGAPQELRLGGVAVSPAGQQLT